MQITNTTKGVRLVNAKVGGSVTQVSLAPGETKDVDVIETAAFKARVKAGEFGTKGSGSKADDGQGGGNASAYTVTEKGAGWLVITQDGKEVTKGLRKDAVEGFDKLSDAEKAAFVAANKAD